MLKRKPWFVLASAVLLWTAAASAHHILGLPHYSYKENYPQVPTLEYPAQSGPFQILLTCYPGKPEPGEAANLAIYIQHKTDYEPYNQAIQVRVLQTFTFGRNSNNTAPGIISFVDNDDDFDEERHWQT